MKITAKQLRNGMMIYRNQQIIQVIAFQSMNDMYHLNVMNHSIHEKQTVDISATEELEMIVADVFKAEFNFNEGDLYYFFNTDTYEEVAVDKKAIKDPKWMMGSQLCVLYTYNGKVFLVENARFVDMKVVKIEAGFNPIATLENGVKVDVNARVRVGDVIRVDTITERYVD